MTIFARINWFYCTIVILVGLTLKIIFYPLLPRPKGSKIVAWFIRLLTFVRVRRVGQPDTATQMYVINHQSEYDIALMESLSSRDLAWVAKKELFEIPFFSLALKVSDDIPLERESKRSLISLLKASKTRLEAGRILCIFPEGTRSETGRMRAFKPGAKVIADSLKLRVQPVVFIDTARHYSNKKRMARPGTVTAVFLESFEADKNDKAWLKELQKRMQETYDRYAAKERA